MLFLSRNWWVFLIRGILAILFGVTTWFFPAAAFLSLVLVFGAFALVDGVFAIVSAFTSNARSENWWWLILEGVVGIVIGVLTVIQPAAMGAAWLYLIAAWAIVTGVFEMITAIRLRKVIEGEFWLILGGAFSVLFGVLIGLFPQTGFVAVGVLIGIYALAFGIMMVMLAIRLKNHRAVFAAAA